MLLWLFKRGTRCISCLARLRCFADSSGGRAGVTHLVGQVRDRVDASRVLGALLLSFKDLEWKAWCLADLNKRA